MNVFGISITPILTALGVGASRWPWHYRTRYRTSSPGFGDSSLNFTLICQVQEFVDQYLVQHELRKRIFRRFRAANIEIPFPIRTVYFRNGDGTAAAAAKTGVAHQS